MDEPVGLPEGVEDFLDQFVVSVETALEEKLLAAFVHGSVASGTFVPFRSDLDLMIVVTQPLDLAAKSDLTRRLWDLPAPASVRGVETRVVTFDEIHESDRMSESELMVSTHPGEPMTSDTQRDGELFIELSIAREHSLDLVGPSAGELIGPTDRESMLGWLKERRMESIRTQPEGYAVLNACRSLVFEEDGEHVSKLAAAEWALERGHPEDLLRHAMAVQKGTRRDRPMTTEGRRFIERVGSRLEEAIEQVSD